MATIKTTENRVECPGAVPDTQPIAASADTNHAVSNAQANPIIFYDGVCGLCNHAVKRLMAIDRRRVFRYAPLQGTTAHARLQHPPEITAGDEAAGGGWLRSLVLLDVTGEHRYSTAVVRILQHVGGFWSILGTLLWIIPRPLRDWGYRVVARNRYQWFGKSESCRLPTPEERESFLP